MPRDRTIRYFDDHRPEYSPGRLRFAATWLAEHLDQDASLVDLGCGTGNALELLREASGITDVAGVDASTRLADEAARRVGCPTVVASVLEEDLGSKLGRPFDVAVMASVLHHLVGTTRRSSFRLARRGLSNALGVLRPGGHLILFEPVFEPGWTMDLLFWVKRLVSAVRPERVEILGPWNNLGAPLVSYLTEGQLRALARQLDSAVEAEEVSDRPVSRLWRSCGIRRRADVTLVLRSSA